MTKRIISIILAAVMLFSFPVLAEDAEQTVMPDSGNMQFAKAMGIVASDAVGTAPVTRLDLATMFCNIIRTDIGLATTQSVQFTDVPTEASSVVANVTAIGIMNGVGSGQFAPDNVATYIQAIKAMVIFLGYDQLAEVKGGYPYGYYMQASDLGLTAGAPKDMNAQLTFEKAVELFKLALNVDFREPVEFNPEVQYQITDNLTYLHYHRDIVRVRGVVRSTYTSDISGTGKTSYDKIRIGSELFTFEPAEFNANEFFGYNVDAYVQLDTDKIIYIENVGTEVTKLSSKEISGLVGDNIEYYTDSGKKKKLAINDYTRVLYNGTIRTSYTEYDINPFVVSTLDGGLTAIDNDGNGVYDIICVDAYDSYKVKKIVENKIYAENIAGIIVDFDAMDYTEGEGYLIYNVLGQPVRISDVEVDNTISVSRDKNGVITEIVVTIDEVIGVINAIQTRGGKLYLTVNGGEFECSGLVTSLGTDEIVIGKKACLRFNKDGLVSEIDQEAYDLWNIGYLTGYSKGKGIDPETQIKVFGEDGKWYVYKLAERITVTDRENKDITDTIDRSAFIAEAGTTADGKVVRQPIMFRPNAEGELKEVIFAASPAASDEGGVNYLANYNTTKESSPLYMMKAMNGARSAEVVADGVNALYWSHKDAGFEGTAFMTKSSVVFAIPPAEDRDDDAKYSVVDPFDYDDWESAATIALYATDVHPVIDIGVKVSTAATAINVKTYAFIVDKIEDYIDDVTGADCCKVSGYMSGKYYEYTDPEGVLLTVGPNGTRPERGDMIRLAVNGYNEISQADFAFDASEKAVYKKDGTKSDGGCSDDTYRNLRYVYGTVKYVDNNIMTVSTTATDGITPVEVNYTVANHRFTKVTKDARGNITITPAAVTDLIGSDDYSTDASKVVVHTQSARAWGVVIYEGF